MVLNVGKEMGVFRFRHPCSGFFEDLAHAVRPGRDGQSEERQAERQMSDQISGRCVGFQMTARSISHLWLVRAI